MLIISLQSIELLLAAAPLALLAGVLLPVGPRLRQPGLLLLLAYLTGRALAQDDIAPAEPPAAFRPHRPLFHHVARALAISARLNSLILALRHSFQSPDAHAAWGSSALSGP